MVVAVAVKERAPREELVRFWALQRLLDEYCFGRGCGGWEGCPIWCGGGAAFRTELSHLCPHEVVRRAMREMREVLRGKLEEYEVVRG
jgi:hypothetical protein